MMNENFKRQCETFVRMRKASYRAAYKILMMRNQGLWPEKANRQEIDEFVTLFTKNHDTCAQAIDAVEMLYGKQNSKTPFKDA